MHLLSTAWYGDGPLKYFVFPNTIHCNNNLFKKNLNIIFNDLLKKGSKTIKNCGNNKLVDFLCYLT